MILNEQLHKNLYRSYFQGHRIDYDKNKSFYKESYYTTNPLYAWFYAVKDNGKGVVAEYKLRNQVNIFNARSQKDFDKLHSFVIKNNLDFSYDELENLKDKDWNILGSEKRRKQLTDIIFSLGYDGYFNFEFDNKFLEELEETYINPVLPKTSNNPSIGVLNSDIFIKVKDYYSIEDLNELSQIMKYHQQEIENVKKGYRYAKKYFGDKTAYDATIASLENYLTLSKDDIVDILEDLRNEKVKENKADVKKFAKLLLESGRISELNYKRLLNEDNSCSPKDLTKLYYWIYAQKK